MEKGESMDKYLERYMTVLGHKIRDGMANGFIEGEEEEILDQIHNIRQEADVGEFHQGRDVDIQIREIMETFDLDMYILFKRGLPVTRRGTYLDYSDKNAARAIRRAQSLVEGIVGECYAEAVAQQLQVHMIHRNYVMAMYLDGRLSAYFAPTWGEPDPAADMDYYSIPDEI